MQDFFSGKAFFVLFLLFLQWMILMYLFDFLIFTSIYGLWKKIRNWAFCQ